MRLIDADALENLLLSAIEIQEKISKSLGIENDDGVRMELKAYKDILNGVRKQPTVDQNKQIQKLEEKSNTLTRLLNFYLEKEREQEE